MMSKIRLRFNNKQSTLLSQHNNHKKKNQKWNQNNFNLLEKIKWKPTEIG